MTNDLITCSDADGVVTLELQTATMAPAFFDAIDVAFEAIAADDTVRAVVVRSSQKAFSYGLDLPAAFASHGDLFGNNLAAGRTKLLALIKRWQGAFTRIATCPVPVIAAMHGWCIGGALDLASACDIRLASADAKISLRETRVAIVADLGSLQRLPRLIGSGLTRELAFTGRDVTADEALRIGLVNAVHADRDAVHAAADAMARQIAANPPLVVRGVKDVLDHSEGRPVQDGLDYVAAWNAAFLASEDLGEALQAFIERRDPVYRGR